MLHASELLLRVKMLQVGGLANTCKDITRGGLLIRVKMQIFKFTYQVCSHHNICSEII